MGFFSFLALLAGLWLLWNISRNTADALDKQTALQYEIVALEKRVEERLAELTNIMIDGELKVQVAPGQSRVDETAAKTSDDNIAEG